MEHEQQQAPVESVSTPQATTPEPNVPTIDNGTLMGILAYLGPLVIIPFLMAKEQPFVKFHIKQGLVLLAVWIVFMVLMEMFFWSSLSLLTSLINLGLLVLTIIGIINVVQKKEAELPLIGHLAQKFTI